MSTFSSDIVYFDMKRNQQFWTPDDQQTIVAAQSFVELSHVALAVLGRMPQPVGQVCGPISTGGLGSIKKNLAVFDATIDRLIAEGRTIFDQMPFEEHFFRIINSAWATRHNNQLLEDFYRPIFESRQVSTLYFIPGWESSKGATWEHELGQHLCLSLVSLSHQ